jgi:glycosyltransferase involved in cell wall biosynthesis
MPSCILTCYYRPKPGGFCKRLFRGINALLDRGHTVHYLAVVSFPIEHPNCHFHRFPWPETKTSGYVFWAVFHLIAPLFLIFIGVKYRVKHLFAFGYTYSLLLQPVRLIKDLPLTLFLRGDTLKKYQTTGKSRSLIRLELFFEGVGIAGTVMYGVSKSLINRINDRHLFFRATKCGILRNDIPSCYTVVYRNASFHFPLRTACVGMIDPGKNQCFLLNVFKKMRAGQILLYLYGTGPDEKILRDLVEQENISNRVLFKGWVQSEQIWPEIDLLLMPSLHEGAPNAVLEALATETPVIASDIPEHREILPQASLLPLSDEKACKEKLEAIVDNPESQLHQIAEEQKFAGKHLRFDWDNTIVRCIVDASPADPA